MPKERYILPEKKTQFIENSIISSSKQLNSKLKSCLRDYSDALILVS